MRCAFLCTLTMSLLAVLMLLLGVWSVHLYHRFTPVYEEIHCQLKPARLGRGSGFVGGQWRLQLVTTTVCQNPNPYSVVLRSTGLGKVYLGKERSHVASITNIPETTLEANGDGAINAEIDIPIKLDAGGIFAGVGLLFGQQFPVYVHNSMEVVVNVNFLVGHFSMKRAFDKDCGMSLQLHRFHPAMGPMVCAEDFDALPPLPDASTNPGEESEILLSARGIAQKDIEKGTRAKNIGLHTAMAVFFGAGILLLAASGVSAAKLMRGPRTVAESVPSASNEPSAPPPADSIVLPRVLGARTVIRGDAKDEIIGPAHV